MSIRITTRDIEILEALYTARCMTTDQIYQLFWHDATGAVGPRKACERRLRKLRTASCIRAIEQPKIRAEPSKPYIYTLDQEGAAHLGIHPRDIEDELATASYPFLNHLLHTNQLRIATVLACKHHGFIIEWLDEKLLKSKGMKEYVVLESGEGASERAGVAPDAFMRIQRGEKIGGEGLFFLETDESTVTVAPSIWRQRGWTRKIRTYRAYFESDAYKKRYGSHLVHVLTVTTSEKRLQHLKEATEAAGGGRRFWFSTFAQAADPARVLSEKIWQRAGSTDWFSLIH